MKDDPTLDSAGPITIIAFVAIVVGIALGITLDANQHWGEPTESDLPAVATAPSD